MEKTDRVFIISRCVTLHITSNRLKIINENQLRSFEAKNMIRLPMQYYSFLEDFGVGTYGGAICINFPDSNVLQEFSHYDFWQHKNAPLTQGQIKECMAIGNSIDGDFIAIHPNIEGYILLPRHSEMITFFPYSDDDFICTIGKVGALLYSNKTEDLFEPVGGNHIFLRFANKDLHDIAIKFKQKFTCDYLIENLYTCQVFFIAMDGYVRFNFAYGFEIAIVYDNYGIDYFEDVKFFLKEKRLYLISTRFLMAHFPVSSYVYLCCYV